MKAISYSLFGYGKARNKNSFDFNSYLRGLMVNARVNRIIYPDWKTLVNIDESTYESEYKPLFNWLSEKGLVRFHEHLDDTPLCKAMLWRLYPIFHQDGGNFVYQRVLCRDLDSVCTYREAQAVQQWINEDRVMHCITDSISHTIPMLGGMIGFKSLDFRIKLNKANWDDCVHSDIDYNAKGSDQTWLNREIYPKFLDSSTDHFVKGMPWNIPEGNGRHYSIDESIEIPVDPIHKELNLVCGHIGAAGYYDVQMVRYLNEIDPFRKEYEEIESKYKHIFYWAK
jgi:hypothetical protein